MNEFEIFNQTDKDIPELETVREVLTHAVLKEKLENVIFNVIIVDNDYIRDLNKNYRNIDRETDVITFDILELERPIYSLIDPAVLASPSFRQHSIMASLIVISLLSEKVFSNW